MHRRIFWGVGVGVGLLFAVGFLWGRARGMAEESPAAVRPMQTSEGRPENQPPLYPDEESASQAAPPMPVPGPVPGAGSVNVIGISRPSGLEMTRPVEPTIQEAQRAAIRYNEVAPEKIQRWRTGAFWRSWLPRLTMSLDQDRDTTVVSSTSKGQTTFTVGPEEESVGLGVDFTWDLGNLIWNPDQTSIDIRSRLTTQLRRNILEGVTRTYFERKRLLAEFAAHPTDDPALAAERSLRIEELTAQLDALTGGWFSQALQARKEQPS